MDAPAHRPVFISYAREDADAALRMAEALRAAGIEVWFDQSELRGGDSWDQKIRRQIKECALFLPIISVHTQERGEGYFRLEWDLADERTRLIARGVPFLLPVAIDHTTEAAALVPERFCSVQWLRLPGRVPTPHFVDEVRRLLGVPRQAIGTAPKMAARSDPPSPEPAGGKPPLPSRRQFPAWAAIGGGIAVVVAVSFFALRPSPPEVAGATARNPDSKPAVQNPQPVEAAPAKSIAVLPFVNLSEDKDTAFFADGMHEEVISNLTGIRGLRVISRQSVGQYRGANKSAGEIAQEMKVAYVVEASVQRSGGEVRVSAQLIDAGTEAPIWAKKYVRDLRDVFAIQSELAEAIAASLRVALSPRQKSLLARRPTESPAAYDLYLQAREKIRQKQSRSSIENLLEAAVELDPKFTAAWAQLCYVRAYDGMGAERTEMRRSRAQAAMDAAVRLAPDSPDAIRAMGDYHYYCLNDFRRAEQYYKTILQDLPNDTEALKQLRAVERRQGRWIESIAHARQYLEFDPGDVYMLSAGLVSVYRAGRHYMEATAAQRRIVSLQPDNLFEAFELALIAFYHRGSTKSVEELFARWSEKQSNSVQGKSLRRQWAGLTGALEEMDRLETVRTSDRSARGNRGFLYAVLQVAKGDIARGRALMEKRPAEIRRQLVNEPGHDGLWAELGEVEALLGHREEALSAARKAVELCPESRDALYGPQRSNSLAFVYAWTGDKDRAIAEYARLLKTVYGQQNIHEMKLNPRYAPLRGDPRFEALLKDSKNNAPLF